MKIRTNQIFLLCLIILNICAGIVCLFKKEYKMAIYWFAGDLY